MKFHRAAVEKNLTRVLLVIAVENFDQRRFARAVFAQQRENFAGVERQIHAVKHLRSGEAFADLPHLQQGRGL